MIDDDTTKPSSNGCNHLDLAGDSLIQVQGDRRWCTSCGMSWRDVHVVVVNDETG